MKPILFGIVLLMGAAQLAAAGTASTVGLTPRDQIPPSLERQIFNGTIEELDPMHLVIAVHCEDKDVVRLMAVKDSSMLKGLVAGDRVMVELNDDATAVKIVKGAADEPSR